MNATTDRSQTLDNASDACPCLNAGGQSDVSLDALFSKPLEATEEMVEYLFKLQTGFAGNEAALSRLWLDWWKPSITSRL